MSDDSKSSEDTTSTSESSKNEDPSLASMDKTEKVEKPKKPALTEKERLELANKLDQDLDAFIDSLERRPYSDGWNEENWEEEIKKHPFFMKELPKEGDELHPLLQGLQKLKYDPEENTKEELAENYKADGNFYMKHKKFRMAIIGYTEGLAQKCSNDDLNAILHNNRSAAHYFLQNFRSSLNDALKAVKLKPTYMKSRIRAAHCYNHLNKFKECQELCSQILDDDAMNEEISDLLLESAKREYLVKRDKRKYEYGERKKIEKWEQLIDVLAQRKVKFFEKSDVRKLEAKDINPILPPLEDFPLSLDDNQCLVWPAGFCYPGLESMDFEQKLSENCTITDCLVALFENLELDFDKKYKPDTVNVYYENKVTGKTHKCDPNKTIREIVEEPTFLVVQGTLIFFIVLDDSDEEDKFLAQDRKFFNRYVDLFN